MTSRIEPGQDFVEWLQDELQKRVWKPQVLARKAGVAPATISNVLNRKRSAGPELLRAIADAFDISQLDVFRAAGLITEELLHNVKAEYEYLRILATIRDDDKRQLAIDMVEASLRRVAEISKADQAKLPDRDTNAKSK